jgi:murein DD-endopeptidase MepM/ murein hydrolase activator NlpD
VRKALLLLGIVLIALLAWMAAGPNQIVDTTPLAVRREVRASPVIASPTTTVAIRGSGAPSDVPPPISPPISLAEPAAPADLIAPTATATVATQPLVGAGGNASPTWDPDAPRPLIVPVAGVARSAMRDMFNEVRGSRRHEAIDILAPRGTEVIAADDGVVKKLFTSVPGGLTVYEFDPDQRYCYYYAHLDRYAAGLHEGQVLRRGEVLGYVGTTGNAPVDAPHLHFALIRLDPDRRWWKGTYVDPYPLLAGGQTP